MNSNNIDLSPPRRTKKLGLVSLLDLKEEISKRKETELLVLNNMHPSLSGRGAQPVYRNKTTGNRVSKEEFLKSRERKPMKNKTRKQPAQNRQAEETIKELELENGRPFARTRDDPHLDNNLRERVRFGDPMANYVERNNRSIKESASRNLPSHSWIAGGKDAAPNRYGIKPGKHWDGVDRSTGFENDYFNRINQNKAMEKQAYLWSVEGM